MTTISLSTDIHIVFIILIGLISLMHLLVLRYKNPYKVRRHTRYLLPIFHIFVASNAFTGIIIMAMADISFVDPKYILMTVATIALIALHIAINKALKWANPKDEEIFKKFKVKVNKILTYEFVVLFSTTLVSPYL